MLGNEIEFHKTVAAKSDQSGAKNHFAELPGTVHPQYRRRGSKTYGPYWFRFWRESGKLRKQYLSASAVEDVKAKCQSRQQRKRDLKESKSRLKTDHLSIQQYIAQSQSLGEVLAVLELTTQKKPHELTALERKRVQRVLDIVEAQR